MIKKWLPCTCVVTPWSGMFFCTFWWYPDFTLFYFVLIFGKKFPCNQEKHDLFCSYFRPVSAIYVAKMLKEFMYFASAFHMGKGSPRSPAAKLATCLLSVVLIPLQWLKMLVIMPDTSFWHQELPITKKASQTRWFFKSFKTILKLCLC